MEKQSYRESLTLAIIFLVVWSTTFISLSRILNVESSESPDTSLPRFLPSDTPILGKGIWIWRLSECEAGDLNAIITKLKNVGIKWVALKGGDGKYFWSHQFNPIIIKQFQDNGIKVLGWQYIYAKAGAGPAGTGGTPEEEASVALKILEVEPDGFIIDVEDYYEGGPNEAVIYLEKIRQKYPNNFIAYTTYSTPEWHRQIPYKEFGKYSNAVIPQVYWGPQITLEKIDAMIKWMEDQWSTLYENLKKEGNIDAVKPLIPAGGVAIKDQKLAGSEITRFCNLVYYRGYYGVSFWHYIAFTDESWNAYMKAPTPPLKPNVDVVLLIDRSGSMVWEMDPTTGLWYYSPQKMENTKWAAKQFTDLMQIGDRVGVVSFATYVRVDYPLSEITSINTKIAVKDKIDQIYASGMTAMGDGLRTAYNQLVSYGDPSHPWVIILMSNGWHNWGVEHPYNVIPDLKAKNIRVYTIGLGAGADSTLLSYIASETGGFYRFAPTSADLLAIYNDIAARVAQAQTVSSVSGLIAQGETKQISVDIDSSIVQATFSISWVGSDLDLTLLRPDGMLIDPNVAAVDPNIEYVEEARYEIYRIYNPMPGTWQMSIMAIDVPSQGESFLAQVTGITSVTLTLTTDKDSYTYPEPIKIMVTLEDTGVPLTGAGVKAIVIRPDASQISIILFDDGLDIHGDTFANDGIYTNYFRQFNEDGSYTIKASATGKTLLGENFSRESQKTVLVSGVPADTMPPKTTLFVGSPQYVDSIGNLYVTSATPFTLTAVDNNGVGSGVAATAYRIYNATYSTGWITYTSPFNLVGLADGSYNIDYNSTDNAGNVEPTNTAIVILDNTGPSITILNPPIGWALQDGVTFIASAIDSGSGVSSLNISIREANGAEGIPIGFEDLQPYYNATTGEWSLFFNTLRLPDGYYVVFAEAADNLGNIGSIIVPYSIRNWAVIELLPASETNKAGRTMPVKFALRIAASVDTNQPFVYNEELTIKIYATANPNEILQESTFGDTARDYRISSVHYITNFKTLKTPMEYTVTIYRKDFEIGSFTFQTVK
jgi:uncharacterized protein YegL